MRNIPISEMLDRKGHTVHTVRPDSTILDAVHMLVEKKVGCLVVMDAEQLVGIITERDILNENSRRHQEIDRTPVADVMTRKVFYGRPEQTLDDVMHVMTERRIRHLPILENEKLVGMISIGDVVKAQLDLAAHHIEHLENYIEGKYPR